MHVSIPTRARSTLALALLFALPTAAHAQHAAPPAAPPAGTIDSFPLASAALRETLTVVVHRPAAHDGRRPLPAMYVLQSGVWFERLRLPAWMDSAAAAGAPPALTVAIPDAEGLEAFRPDTPRGEAYVRFIADELVPAVERRYAVERAPGGRLLLGFSAGANVLVDVAVRRPGRFARVAAVSPGWMLRDEAMGIGLRFHDAAIADVRRAPRPLRTGFRFVWGDGPSEWERVSREHGAAVMAALRERGAAVLDAGLVPGDHGLALARSAMPAAVAWLLGPAEAP